MSFYHKLPDELKLEIWENAMPELGGVHHFKIGFDQPRTYGQTLIIEPQQDAMKDSSTWVGLCGLSMASRMSSDVVKKSEHADRVLFWQKSTPTAIKEAAYTPELPAFHPTKPQNRKGKANSNEKDWTVKPMKALINGDKDVVCFTVSGSDFDLNWLNWSNNHQRFRQLTQVAFDYSNAEGKGGPNRWMTRPFACICVDSRCDIKGYKYCYQAIAKFLRVFENLRKFYLIIPVTATCLALPAAENLPCGIKRARGGQAIKKTGPQRVTEAMDKFKARAQENGLSIFQDRKRTYYEADHSDMPLIKEHKTIQMYMKELVYTWDRMTHLYARRSLDCPWYSPRANWMGVKFKLLVCRAKEEPGMAQAEEEEED